MTILLYDYIELQERTSRSLRIWKGWHITLYILAAIFGILNYTFLHSAKQLVENNCILYPRHLEFYMIEKFVIDESETVNDTKIFATIVDEDENSNGNGSVIAQNIDTLPENGEIENSTDAIKTVKREAQLNETTDYETTITVNNVTVILGNRTHRLALDVSRTFFGKEEYCQFAEYTPILSTIFAMVWLTLFIMCPGGGRTRSGLQQPWRILTPALLFAIVMVGLMGHNFTTTNGGLHAFCEAFHNVTNATTCSPVSNYVESAWNSSMGVSGRVGSARAASAGVWAAWACVAALLLARCLAAPDFEVKRTGVYLAKDPQMKITPHLKTSSRRSNRSSQNSPTKPDNASIMSEPTAVTEVVTASVEHGDNSYPTSLIVTPHKNNKGEMVEMAFIPHELPEDQP